MSTKYARFLPKRTAVSGRVPTGTTGDENSFIQQGEIAVNTADKKIYSFDGSEVFEFGKNSFLGLSGGTINGNFTVTGNSVFNSASATTFSANSIVVNNYIDFATGSTATTVTSIAGRTYFDNYENALSYFPTTPNMDVAVNVGQEELIKVYNNTGAKIYNGQACHINGTTDGVPTITLATGTIIYDDSEVSGIATHDIADGTYGFITKSGIVRDIIVTGVTPGSSIYLSDKIVGGLEYDINNINLESRINKIGLVINTGITTGKILVNLRNENITLSLTDRQINVLNGNVSSTGIYQFSGITTASTNTVNVAPAKGWIVSNTKEFALAPKIALISYTGQTGVSITNIASADETYFLLSTAHTIFQQTTYPTSQQRRQNILLGKVAHPDHSTIISINNNVDYSVSPMSALRDMFTPIKLINDGIVVSPNGANLNFNTNSGFLYGMGINWVNDELNPNEVTISAKTAAQFNYRTQTGGTTGYISVIDPTKYDLNGVITSIGIAGSNDATNQRIYMYPSGNINIQYGQKVYGTLALALAAQQSETFIKAPNVKTTAILIGILAVRNDIVADGQGLNNTNYAVFTPASIFGESIGGVNGISTTTLQQAYDNSTTPEITINSTLDGLSVKNGTGNANNITKLIEGVDDSNNVTSIIRADGYISGNTFQTSGFTANSYGVTATTISGELKFDVCYLTYAGLSGTTSGTKGCVLSSPGNWVVTKFSTSYFIDTKDGDITITVPDANALNEGKTMIFVYPRLVSSNKYLYIVTESGQFVGQYTSQKLASPDDRIEIISVPFSSNGSLAYKYRIKSSNISVHEQIKVSAGGNQLFSDIKTAVDFVNAYADGPRVITIYPGTYYMSATTKVDCPYDITIDGFGTDVTKLIATSALTTTPMFEIVSRCDFNKLHFSGTTGYGLIDDECCLDCSTSGLYFETHQCLIDGFYKGIEIDENSSTWIFDSTIYNCVDGIYCGNGNIGISEVTLSNNNIGINLSAVTSASSFSIQNTILEVNNGQIGIKYRDDVVTPKYFFATGNAFYGDGTFLSGLTFTSSTQSDIRIENNVGLRDYKPESYLWISGNTTATTLTTQNTYYKSRALTTSFVQDEKIKFSGGASTYSLTYLPKISRFGTFTISGDLSVNNNGDIVSVALYKNGNIRLQDIDVRCTTSNIPYSFAFVGYNLMNQGDYFDIRLSDTTTANRTSILRTLMFLIKT